MVLSVSSIKGSAMEDPISAITLYIILLYFKHGSDIRLILDEYNFFQNMINVDQNSIERSFTYLTVSSQSLYQLL